MNKSPHSLFVVAGESMADNKLLVLVALLAIVCGSVAFPQGQKDAEEVIIDEEEVTTTEPPTTTVRTACRDPRVSYPIEVTFEELSDELANNSVVLIDVRNPWELVDFGMIPNSHNVPLPIFQEAFLSSPEEFLAKYGFEKPDPADKNVVLTCRSGRRIVTAWEEIEPLGYCRVRLYSGSYLEWKKNGGKLTYPKSSSP